MNVARTSGRTPKCLSANCGVQRVSVKNSFGETIWKNDLRVKCPPFSLPTVGDDGLVQEDRHDPDRDGKC